MSILALWQLARPRAAADRRRWLLVAGACALTGMLLLTGARVLRYHTGRLALAPYVEQEGLRPGVLTAVMLCCLLMGMPTLACTGGSTPGDGGPANDEMVCSRCALPPRLGTPLVAYVLVAPIVVGAVLLSRVRARAGRQDYENAVRRAFPAPDR